MKKSRIALSGDPGSFSEEAAIIYSNRIGEELDLVYATDMEGVLQNMDESKALLGIFPVVNSRGGLVHPAFAAMGRHSFEMIDEIWMEVHQCLLVLPGKKKKDITHITTHSQAIDQCDRYIKQTFPKAILTEWDDTAKAAKDLAKGNFSDTTAVIAPMRSANLYGLEVLEKGIQDQHPNLTTFIVVKH